MPDPAPNLPQPPDLADALSNIEDDESAIHEARPWAENELINGRTPEQLLAQLIEEGWDTDQAEEIVETARKQTRAERGVVTRDDIVQGLNVDYRNATRGLSVAFRSGLFGLYGFTTGFMAAMRTWRKLGRFRERNRSEEQNEPKP